MAIVERLNDRPPELVRFGELRPVAGGHVDVGELPRGRKLGNVAGGDPGAEIIAGELRAYDCGRDVISPVVGELKWFRGDAPGRGDRSLPELFLGILVEVTKVRLVEVVPRGQRDLAILDGESAEDGLTVAGREASRS